MVDLVNICDKLIKTYNTTIIDQIPLLDSYKII